MLEIVIILITAFLLLPLCDLVSMVPPDAIQARLRIVKIILIVIALIVLIYFLFFGNPGVVLFPHTWATPLNHRP